ncbi:helix-turn-helix domain-containing protein [Winogradskyella sp.]
MQINDLVEDIIVFVILFGLVNALAVSLYFVIIKSSPKFLRFMSLVVCFLAITFLQDFLNYFGNVFKFRPLWFISNIHLTLLIPGLISVALNFTIANRSKIFNYLLAIGIIPYLMLIIVRSGFSFSYWFNQHFKTIEALIAVIAIIFLLDKRLINNKKFVLENRFVVAFIFIFIFCFANKLIWNITLVFNKEFWYKNYKIFFYINLTIISLSSYLLSFLLINYFYLKRRKKTSKRKNNFLKIDESLINDIEKLKLYRNNNVTIDLIASQLGVKSIELSNGIYHFKGLSFNDFINEMRLNYFIELIGQGKHKEFTIISLATESGFNSKSTFNRYFKKRYNVTPLEYIKTELGD